MTVVALVTDPTEAKPVITWAGRFAAAKSAELVIFHVPTTSDAVETALAAPDDQPQDETLSAISKTVAGIVRTKRARKGRLPPQSVSVRRVIDPDPVAGTIARLRAESPDLFIGAALENSSSKDGKTLAQRIAAKVACDSIVLFGNCQTAVKTKQISVGVSEGTHDASAIQLAGQFGQTIADCVTVISVEATIGPEAIEVGERKLRSLLRESDVEESSHIRVKAVLSDEWTAAIAEEAAGCDLLLVGANTEKRIGGLLEGDLVGLVGSFRRAPRLDLGKVKDRTAWILPQINATDYADLYEKLQAGSRWNSDFVVMLSLAAAIATLGLLQSSPAVVIGSMLLAPLMTPMIGMGLALNQGNGKLAYASFRAIGRGFFAALAISIVLGLITPGLDLTPEIAARTEPNILDMLVALFSGAAAAYALARPSLAGTIAGVAIATALVPPLCSFGIALAYRQYPDSAGALCLLLANVLAIILAAAATFRMMGLTVLTASRQPKAWVRYVVTGLSVCALILSVPLVSFFLRHVHEGKNSAYAFALTTETRDALLEHTEKMPGVTVLFAGRAGIDRDTDPVDIGIILSSKHPLPRSEADELIELLRTTMDNPDLRVMVECVANGWAEESAGDALASAAGSHSE